MIKAKEPAKAVQKTRTASPSRKKTAAGPLSRDRTATEARAGGMDGPVEASSTPRGSEKVVPISVSLPPSLVIRLEADAHRRRETRSKAVRRILEAGLAK